MSTITDALNEAEPFRTAGALPSTRTFGMVENALESDDIDVVKAELVHTRAHYQSLEYILNDEETILTSLRASIAAGEYPTPTTPDEALELAARVYSKVIVEVGYDNAHNIGFFVGVLGMSVQDALKQLYTTLDFSDPDAESEVDRAVAELLGSAE